MERAARFVPWPGDHPRTDLGRLDLEGTWTCLRVYYSTGVGFDSQDSFAEHNTGDIGVVDSEAHLWRKGKG